MMAALAVLNSSLPQLFVATLCLLVTWRLFKLIWGTNCKIGNGRKLDFSEQFLQRTAWTRDGQSNVSVALSVSSKQMLLYQHIHDALVLLVKRQPMLRAIITTLSDGQQYFVIKNMDEAVPLFDIAMSDTNIADWKTVIYVNTSKIHENPLPWRVVILKEEFDSSSQEYINMLMFAFKHSSFDGASGVKFCEQFLNNINEISSGFSDVEKKVSSLDLLPCSHDLVTNGRIGHTLFRCIVSYSGLRPIFHYFMRRLLFSKLEKKAINPYYRKHPAKSLEGIPSEAVERLNVKTFTNEETKAIVKACRANDCTVTGAITASVHLAFYKLIGETESSFPGLESVFTINSRRYCDPKPPEEYIGKFTSSISYYMEYSERAKVDFWTMAEESSAQLKRFVKTQPFVAQYTMSSNLLDPNDLTDFYNDPSRDAISKSCSNMISSFGSFDLSHPDEVPVAYKMQNCYIHTLSHGVALLMRHFIYTINGKLTWVITSDATLDDAHSQQFNNACFDELIKNCPVE